MPTDLNLRTYFSNISCIEEFELKKALLPNDELRDALISSSLCKKNALNVIEDFACILINGMFTWFDLRGNKIEPPDTVRANFLCPAGTKSLKGSPRIVYGNFSCSNTEITSLEGSPITVNGYFDCSKTKITSIRYSPKNVNIDFMCIDTDIESLDGSPEIVNGCFLCSNNHKLSSLKGSTKHIKHLFDCSFTNISSLEGSPESVNFLNCSDTNIESLKHIPKILKGLNCSNTYIESLNELVGRFEGNNIYCFNTFVDLRYVPKEIKKHII